MCKLVELDCIVGLAEVTDPCRYTQYSLFHHASFVSKWLAYQHALDESIRYDYGGPEPLNALANLRLSQSKPEEAAKSAEEAFRRLGLCGGFPLRFGRISCG